MLLIQMQHIEKTYRMDGIEVHALRGVTLSIEPGEFVAIMGPSGSGKSTCMNIMGLLDRPTSGIYSLEGTDVITLDDIALARIRNRRLGFVFQSFNLLPRTPALENVELPMVYAGVPDRREKAMAALEAVGLRDWAGHLPTQLSGGQQQRVAVARALVGDPSILLADEPTGNLDSKNGEAVMELLRELHRGGATICMVTHDPRYARHAERGILLFDGRVVEEQPAPVTQ